MHRRDIGRGWGAWHKAICQSNERSDEAITAKVDLHVEILGSRKVSAGRSTGNIKRQRSLAERLPVHVDHILILRVLPATSRLLLRCVFSASALLAAGASFLGGESRYPESPRQL